MKVLICGNLGYIGPTVCKHLKTSLKEAHITGLDTGFFAPCVTTQGRLSDTYCDEQIYADIRDVSLDFYSKFDAIVLLAAISNDPMGKRFEKVTDEINNLALSKIINSYATLPDKTVVFASSCSMYGAGGDDAKTELDSINPLTAYARSKVAVENVMENVTYATGSKATSLRFSTACGMSDRLRLDLVLNDFVASAIINDEVVVLSDGSPWRPLINVNDMARAIEWALIRDHKDNMPHVAVNVGSNDWNYSVRQLAEAVVSKIPNASLQISSSAQPDKRSYKVNFDMFKELAPEYQPKSTLDATIDDLIIGISPIRNILGSNFRSSNFMRLKMLETHLETNSLSSDLRWTDGN